MDADHYESCLSALPGSPASLMACHDHHTLPAGSPRGHARCSLILLYTLGITHQDAKADPPRVVDIRKRVCCVAHLSNVISPLVFRVSSTEYVLCKSSAIAILPPPRRIPLCIRFFSLFAPSVYDGDRRHHLAFFQPLHYPRILEKAANQDPSCPDFRIYINLDHATGFGGWRPFSYVPIYAASMAIFMPSSGLATC